MNERLNALIPEITAKRNHVNCFEFDYHWEYYGLLWYPWFLKINTKPLRKSVHLKRARGPWVVATRPDSSGFISKDKRRIRTRSALPSEQYQ